MMADLNGDVIAEGSFVGSTVGGIKFGENTTIYRSQEPAVRLKEAMYPAKLADLPDDVLSTMPVVPSCFYCQCPDLIDDDPELWECRSCGAKYVFAYFVTTEDARAWKRPVNSVLDSILI